MARTGLSAPSAFDEPKQSTDNIIGIARFPASFARPCRGQERQDLLKHYPAIINYCHQIIH
jgi:hypothetical protein